MNVADATTDHALENQHPLRQLVHDLRTPLGVISMGLEALEFVRTDDEKFDMLVQMMKSATSELNELVAFLASENALPTDDTTRS